jgi:hypothetical protein
VGEAVDGEARDSVTMAYELEMSDYGDDIEIEVPPEGRVQDMTHAFRALYG